MSADPFWWDENDEDEARAECKCGWRGPWRDRIADVRADEKAHDCDLSDAWRGFVR